MRKALKPMRETPNLTFAEATVTESTHQDDFP